MFQPENSIKFVKQCLRCVVVSRMGELGGERGFEVFTRSRMHISKRVTVCGMWSALTYNETYLNTHKPEELRVQSGVHSA